MDGGDYTYKVLVLGADLSLGTFGFLRECYKSRQCYVQKKAVFILVCLSVCLCVGECVLGHCHSSLI